MVGPGHRCSIPAAPRQDAYRLAVDKSNRYLLIAIADGMSDSSHSHLGANIAANALVQRLRQSDDPADASPQDLFVQAAQQMVATARQRGLSEDSVRAAALIAVIDIDPAPDGYRTVRFASLADVGAWVRAGRSWLQIAGDPKEGLDGGKLDKFLPFHPRDVRTSSCRLGPKDVLALASDGIGDVLGLGAIGVWFADQWAEPPHISDFIDAVGFEAKGEQDDRTAVVLWCTPGRRP